MNGKTHKVYILWSDDTEYECTYRSFPAAWYGVQATICQKNKKTGIEALKIVIEFAGIVNI